MAITYPLSLPTNPGPVRVEFTAVNSVGENRSPWTYQTQVQEHAGKSWAAEITLPLMKREQAEEWIAFLLACNGKLGTFLLGDPAAKLPRGNAVGVPLVDGAHAAQASELATKGWAVSLTGVLLKGDLIQVGQRLYKVLEDVNSDGSGEATFEVWPNFREPIVNNEPIIVTEAKGLFRLADNITELFSANDAKHYMIGFSAVEAV